ncbi:1-aminocyclopropane-1-carboxylate deaminase [Embleya scabrispora]|uniref:1-aminocyclopropane-1-carboxylate deaminase n=1 Tax=Embleya scabrispora TaxID=159449 RepID=A0A1T3P2W3_9ACTN|nr:pyridoxal-phosphate dependent enzyme [Embleya scabrispora]OPC83285.1 1-aminocyclopropane-1-carboxylate deaminase [Embleya scabrispora]
MRPRLPSPLCELSDPRLTALGLRLRLKRDDLIHPEVPGNKWRKLKYNLAAARERGEHTLLTFGGAYSNHLRATAAAGRALGLATVGVVRGEELADRPLNPSLAFAAERGMRLVFVDRATYRAKHTPQVLERLLAAHGPAYVLPEGGSNEAAVRGCAELPAELGDDVDTVCVAVGTGGTLAGIAAGLPAGRRAIGFAVLRGGFLADEVADLQRRTYGAPTDNWHVENDFHHGGYARRGPELDAFLADFATRHGFAPEPVYVGKMLFGLFALAERGAFAPGTRLVAVVTG